VTISQAKVERLEEKIHEMETKGVQLKESIIGHESSKIKDELGEIKSTLNAESINCEIICSITKSGARERKCEA
jgi:hypothetical protein